MDMGEGDQAMAIRLVIGIIEHMELLTASVNKLLDTCEIGKSYCLRDMNAGQKKAFYSFFWQLEGLMKEDEFTNDHWIDSIIGSTIVVENGDLVSIYGKVIVGKISNPEGRQWDCDFEVKSSENRSRVHIFPNKTERASNFLFRFE